MVRDVARRGLSVLQFFFLHIGGDGDMRHAGVRERAPTGKRHHILDVGRAHDAGGVQRDVCEQLVVIDILLSKGVHEVVIRQASDGNHRSTVELRIVQAVQKMDAAGTGRGQAATQPARPLCMRTGHQRSGLFVPDLDEAQPIGARPDCFHHAIDAVTRHAEDCIDTPIDEGFHENI